MRTHSPIHGIHLYILLALACAGLLQGQSSNLVNVDAKVSISFQTSGGVTVGRGVSIAFQNASSNEGRGVSIAFDTPVITTGAISATTNLPAATFTITGPANYTGSGRSFTQANAPAGNYTIAYGAVDCYSTPPSETKTLIAGGTLTFSAATYQGNGPTLSSAGMSIDATAFTGYLGVISSNPSCSWTAKAASTGWLQLTSGLKGTTSGQIGYAASANPATTIRTGTITVSGQIFTVTQEGVSQGATPFTLTATPKCSPGDSSHPAGPRIDLTWNGPSWSRQYEVLRDGQVIETVDQSPWPDVTGLTPGQSYTYQIRASNSSTSILSSQVKPIAMTGCSQTTTLRVEDVLVYDSTLVSGTSTTAKVRLSEKAPRGGVTVTLTSSNPALTVPASVTIPEGVSLGYFTATAGSVAASPSATITAAFGTSSDDVKVTLKPNAASSTGIAYLFLHGLNSSPGTWRALINDKDPITHKTRFGYCDQLQIFDPYPYYRAEFDKQIYDWDPLLNLNPLRLNKPANGCYALEFNSPDWESGDGLNYVQLGAQVGAAVNYIVRQRNPSAIVFVGHSRGGLAARAFLQQYQSRNELAYKVGLITIGTPHQGSPFGRVKWWMDQEKLGTSDLFSSVNRFLWNYAPLEPGLVPFIGFGAADITGRLKPVVFSPSAGYLASAHNTAGTLDLCLPESQALCQLTAGSNSLKNVVSSAGQIISTGLRLGENVVSVFSVLSPPGNLLDVTAALPGDNQRLIAHVFENIPLNDSWRSNTDSIVPAASQDLNAVAQNIVPLPSSKYLVRINHTSETGCTDCINQVLDTVISQPALSGLAAPVSPSEAQLLSEQSSISSPRVAEEDQSADPETAATRVRIRWLNADALVETALAGDRLNNLEGLLSRRELRQRDGADQRQIVAGLRQRLLNSNQETRVSVARLLGDVPAEYSADTTIELLRAESDPQVRRAALKTVRTLAEDAATSDSRRSLSQTLQRLTNDSPDADPELFLAAVDGLVALGGPEEVEKLIDLYQRSTEGRKQLLASRMVALRNGEGAQRLAAYLTVDPHLRQERTRLAGEVLSEMSTEESVTGLLDWATGTDSELQRSEALRWLKKNRSTRGRERLETVLQQGTFKSELLRQSLQDQLAAGEQCTTKPAMTIQ